MLRANLNPRIALLIPKIPGLADNPRIAHTILGLSTRKPQS